MDNKQAQTNVLGPREISLWVGACDTRGHGPPAQWRSFPSSRWRRRRLAPRGGDCPPPSVAGSMLPCILLCNTRGLEVLGSACNCSVLFFFCGSSSSYLQKKRKENGRTRIWQSRIYCYFNRKNVRTARDQGEVNRTRTVRPGCRRRYPSTTH